MGSAGCVGSRDSLNSLGSLGLRDSLGSRDSLNSLDSLDSLGFRDSLGSRHSFGTVDSASHQSSSAPSGSAAPRLSSPASPGAITALHSASAPASPAPSRHPSAPPAVHHQRPKPCPEHLIAAVRERARIADLFPVSALRRSGRAFVTTCPWHDDRRPSLTVNPDTNRVHCFVCDKGTDAIGWLQDRQGLTFIEAVHTLAERHGIPIPEEDPEAAARAEALRQERQRLMAWRQRQQQQFHQALLDDLHHQGPASIALRQRGLTEATAISWGLGLNGTRLMLPIADCQGRVHAFSGRTLSGEEPKYRNSAGDALFRKQELLFGLHHAAAAIRRSGEALLVEGPLDVIQLHQAGFDHAVASMGTSLSLEQRQALVRAGAKRLLIAYDGDNAGHRATARLIDAHRTAAITTELDLAVVTLPPSSDPDACIREQGPQPFHHLLACATHWLHWELDLLLAPLQADPDTLSVVQRCEQDAKRLLALLPAGALRQRAEQRLRDALGVAPRVAPAPKVRLGDSTGRLKGGKAWAPCGASAGGGSSGGVAAGAGRGIGLGGDGDRDGDRDGDSLAMFSGGASVQLAGGPSLDGCNGSSPEQGSSISNEQAAATSPEQASSISPKQASSISPEQAAAIERAEFRALRLFLCSPVCRDPLAVLVITHPLYRQAQQCLAEAHRRLPRSIPTAQDDPLTRAILALCPQLEPHLASLLEGLCTMEAAAREALFLAPEGEMMAILDVLEPVD